MCEKLIILRKSKNAAIKSHFCAVLCAALRMTAMVLKLPNSPEFRKVWYPARRRFYIKLKMGSWKQPKFPVPPIDFETDDGQLSLLPAADNELIMKIKALDVNTLTPIEAMQTLYELTKEGSSVLTSGKK